MAKTKCGMGCGRFAKSFNPPRCVQCVTGRKPGQRGPDTKWRKSLVRRRPSTIDKMVEADARRRERVA